MMSDLMQDRDSDLLAEKFLQRLIVIDLGLREKPDPTSEDRDRLRFGEGIIDDY